MQIRPNIEEILALGVYYPFWGVVLHMADKYRRVWGIFLGGQILVCANRAIQSSNETFGSRTRSNLLR